MSADRPPFPYDAKLRPDGSTYYERRSDWRATSEAWVATQPDKSAALMALLSQAMQLRGVSL